MPDLFGNLVPFLPRLLQAAVVTIEATAGGIALASVLAFVAGLMALARWRLVRAVARVYIEIFRGTSELVQLFWFFFAVPILIGLQFEPLFAGILVLGLNLGAYMAEVVRGAVLAVPTEQYEAATALSMTSFQRMRKVILPQAMVAMLPPFNNLFIQLLKASALLSFIFVEDITKVGRDFAKSSGRYLLVYMIILALYFVLSYVITLGVRLLERRANTALGKVPTRSRRPRRINTRETA